MIVDGAVGMVEMALQKLSDKNIVELDEERKVFDFRRVLMINPAVRYGMKSWLSLMCSSGHRGLRACMFSDTRMPVSFCIWGK